MKTTEQEIIDMENFYATATLEEAIAYFKSKSAQCFTVIKKSCKKALKIIGGIARLFTRPQSTAANLRKELNAGKVCMNSVKVDGIPGDAFERFEMESLLCEARKVLKSK